MAMKFCSAGPLRPFTPADSFARRVQLARISSWCVRMKPPKLAMIHPVETTHGTPEAIAVQGRRQMPRRAVDLRTIGIPTGVRKSNDSPGGGHPTPRQLGLTASG